MSVKRYYLRQDDGGLMAYMQEMDAGPYVGWYDYENLEKRHTQTERDACTWASRAEEAEKKVAALEAEVAGLRKRNDVMRKALEKIADETAATWVCDTANAALTQPEQDDE